VLSFATVMPVAKLAVMTAEHDTRIWRVVEHHVQAARDQLEFSGVKRVGMEETSTRKGQGLHQHLCRPGGPPGLVRHRRPLRRDRGPLRH
jgi:hypothetical protein